MKQSPDDTTFNAGRFIDILRWRADLQPDRLIFRFGSVDEPEAASLTLGEWDRSARSLGAYLQQHQLGSERALLLYPPELGFLPAFFGCLYGGAIAVPTDLPRLNRPMTRLRAIVEDCRPRAVLTNASIWAERDRWCDQVPELKGAHWINTEALSPELAGGWRDPGVGPQDLAFLQYTSGSTSQPKGVMVSHANLVHNSRVIQRSFKASTESRGVFWLPLFHDMGLIGGVLQTLFCGGTSTLFSPVAFLQRPARWLETISETQATISGGPNFAYDLCVRKVTEEQRSRLDLSRWKVAFNGAEPVRPETLERFAETFAPCGFRREAFLPCYGLAEATLLVSGGWPTLASADSKAWEVGRFEHASPQDPSPKTLAGSGQLGQDQTVVVVNTSTQIPCVSGDVGEIWVSSPSVAQGYWNHPEATAETFRATLADGGETLYLRTGDLGFLQGQDLYVTGRLKDLMIVRGRNVYPQDIEATAENSHPSLRADGGAAFSIDVDGEERLVVVHEIERAGHRKENEHEAIAIALRQAIAERHDLDVHAVCLIKTASLPKTSSGKVRRRACREAFLAGTLEVVTTSIVGSARPRKTEAAPDVNISAHLRSQQEIETWLVARLAILLGIESQHIGTRTPFASFGLGSLRAVELAGELQDWLGETLSPTLAYEYPTVEALARHLAVTKDSQATEIKDTSGPLAEPIAIVGIGCRFPGAHGPEAFWKLLRDGVDAVGPVPTDRWETGNRSKVNAKKAPGQGGFLEQVDRFDASFFGISPREAMRIDPQQRLLLEVAWEALEDSGQNPEGLAGTQTGVFIGISTNDYGRLQAGRTEDTDAYIVTGNAASIAANRLSYVFDFHGPSLAIDTACSSSLVAVHLACRSLQSGESTLALAGGVNLLLSSEIAANFAEAGFLAPDGHCKSFDARADGYVRSEGVGVVVLKPISQALADGDPVYALIRGGAVNQDGRSNGLTAPSRQAQERVLRDAYRNAGVSPTDIHYVEAHGSGTLLGDPIEARALGAILAGGRTDEQACVIGSVKANLGHLEAAAGIAGLIKTALSLHQRTIPPSLHFESPNPHIPFHQLRLRVPRQAEAWPGSQPGRAGVSAFGFGGTNAHLVLEEAPALAVPPFANPWDLAHEPEASDAHGESARSTRRFSPFPASGNGEVFSFAEGAMPQLLPVSARTPRALRALLAAYHDALAISPDDAFRAFAYSAGARRGHHDHRLAFVAATRQQALEQISRRLDEATHENPIASRIPSRLGKLVFVFSGQGTRWIGVGAQLLKSEPIFQAALEQCDACFQPLSGWSLIAAFRDDTASTRSTDGTLIQPMLLALQVGLSALWRSWGIVPNAVVGHSLGEVAAAHFAGAITLEEAFRIVYHRARVMGKVAGLGLTAAIGLPADDVERLVAANPAQLTIAARNGPNATIVSGDPAAVRTLVESLQSRQVFVRLLDTDCAFHSPQLDPFVPELVQALTGLQPRTTNLPLVSTVTGKTIAGESLDASYWGRNLREPVLFSAAIRELIANAPTTFVEIGPHPSLSSSITQFAHEGNAPTTALPSLRRGEDEQASLKRSLGDLYTQGYTVAWKSVGASGQAVRLPSYPWQRERFWLESHAQVFERNGHMAPAPRFSHKLDASRWIYQQTWRASKRLEHIAANGHRGSWLILSDTGGIGDQLRSILQSRGIACDVRRFEEGSKTDFQRLFTEQAYDGVVHLWSLDSASDAELEVSALTRSHQQGVGSALSLAQALLKRERSSRPKLWLVTRGTQILQIAEADDAERSSERPFRSLGQAPLWGMGRSLANELTTGWGGTIDLPHALSNEDVIALADELLSSDGEDQVVFRGGQRYVPRLLQTAQAETPTPALTLRPEGTYLITGGFGALGRLAASWLAERGARRIVLVGRHPMPPRSRWNTLANDDKASASVALIQRLESAGVTVVTAAADVSDREQITALFDSLRETMPPLRGILHAAGSVTDHTVAELDQDALASVLRPKVEGTWLLHELSRDYPLDFFVLFSSIAAVLGAKEAHYAAANRFQDAYAQAARRQGQPALSVNWGPWAGDGMASATHRTKALQLLGFQPLDSQSAFAALEQLIVAGVSNALVADVDWSVLKSLGTQTPNPSIPGKAPGLNGSHGQFHRDPLKARGLLAEIDGVPPDERARTKAASTSALRERLAQVPPQERQEELVAYFRNRLGNVLRLDPERIDLDRPLNLQGLDSLMAIELKGQVEADLGTVLSLTSLMEGPTLSALASQALSEWDRFTAQSPEERRSSSRVTAVESRDEYPLSSGQRALWYAHQLDRSGACYNMAGAARISTRVDVAVLGRSLQRLVERHEALRTSFVLIDGRPVQRIRSQSNVTLQVENASGWDDDQIRTRLAREADRPFDLERDPLLRVHLLTRSPDEHYLLMVVHHIVCDFWSFTVLMQDFGQIVKAEREGMRVDLEPLTQRIVEQGIHQAEHLAGPQGAQLWSYWREQLRPPLPVLELPVDHPRPASVTHRGGTRSILLDKGLAQQVSNLAEAQGASVYATLLALFQLLLARLSGQGDIIVGCPVAGRDRPGLTSLVGYMVNPLPLRAKVLDNPTFLEHLERVRQAVLGGLEHQHYPFPQMVEQLGLVRDPSRSPVFQTMFVFQKAQRLDSAALTAFALRERGPAVDLGGFSIESIPLPKSTAEYDLTLMMAETGTGLIASLEYNADLFEVATVDRILGQFQTLLENVVADPRQRVATIPILSEAERFDVLVAKNDTTADFPRHSTVLGLIEDQAARTPQATALATSGNTWTYQTLNARADRLADRLRALGVGPEVRVALCVERSTDMIEGILAILKAGGAYVPIDPSYPADRLQFLLEDSRASVLLTQKRLRESLPPCQARVICLDAGEEPANQATGETAGPEHLAYVIYTSGSTGKPKGVMVSHENLTHSTWARALYYREPVGRFLLLSSFAFDSSVAGIFWTLSQGGELVLPSEQDGNDPDSLARLIDERQITHLLCVPTLYSLLLAEAPVSQLKSLRAVIVAGEPCPSELPARHKALLPHATLFNEYGPTEATVWSTVHTCEDSGDDARVPIGRPIANTQVYILDPHFEPLPVGVTGELFVAGAGVTRGYLDRPALTAERFLPDPFSQTPGGRFYRTGDLARWRTDGTLEFLGRVDAQVKIRGHRIELGEVEAALSRHPEIRETVAASCEDASGVARLVAYVVPVNGDLPTSSELRHWLRASLPEPMVPSEIVPIATLPLSPNGKVDRTALPRLEVLSMPEGQPYDPPKTEREKLLAQSIEDVLSRRPIGIHENIFDLGLDSIQAIRIVSRVRRGGFYLGPIDLFQHPTIAALASVAKPMAPPSAQMPDSLGSQPALELDGDIEDAYPLSSAQEGMLYHSLDTPEIGVYVQQFTCLLQGDVRPDELLRSWQQVIDHHPVLRTAFPWVDSDRPMQAVYRHIDVPFREEDLRGLTPAAQTLRLEAFFRTDREQGFSPSVAPLLRFTLFRLDGRAYRLVWTYHHLIMDGWCLPLVLNEVLATYDALGRGDRYSPIPARPFRDYIHWLSQRDLSESDAYWKRILGDFKTPTPLGIDQAKNRGRLDPTDLFDERAVNLSLEATGALQRLAKAYQVTLNSVVLGAYALLLARYARRNDVVFGVTVSGRPPELDGIETMVGMFINTLPMRISVDEETTLLPWLAELQRRQMELRQYEWSPLIRVHEASSVPRGTPLFESIFVFENYPLDAGLSEHAGRLGVEEPQFLERTNYPLTVMVFPGETLRLRISFDTQRFQGEAIERMLGHLQILLEGFVASSHERLANFSILSQAERRELLRRGTGALPDSTDLDRLSDEEINSLLEYHLIAEEVGDE